MKSGTILKCLCVALVPGLLHAEIYRWVDANGQVHYSDRNNQSAVVVLESDTSAGSYVVPEEEPVDGAEEFSANSKRGAEVREEQCKKAKARLVSYRDAGTVLQRDALGEETEVSAEQRVQLILKTEAQVKTLCKGDASN